MVLGRFLRPAATEQACKDVKTEAPATTCLKGGNDDDWDWTPVEGTARGTFRFDEAVPLSDVTAALVVDDGFLLINEQSAPMPASEATAAGQALETLSTAATDQLGAFSAEAAALESDSGSESPLPDCHGMGTTSPAQPGEPADLAGSAREPAAAHEPPAGATAAPAAPKPVGVAENRDGYLCGTCDNPIFKDEDVLSSNYHAMTGPGYLTSTANNVNISPELQRQLYTTGKYTVREVSCSCCSAVLGVTYVGAVDARNRYKVGKFLVGRDRLRLPDGKVHPMEAEG